MKVSELMTRKLITVRPLESVEGVIELLQGRGVRHLLVMDKKELVGIISDRDLKRAMDPSKTQKNVMAIGGMYFLMEPVVAEEIMTSHPVTIGAEANAKAAAKVMVKHRFGALPVVDDGHVVGVITETDLLRYFADSELEDQTQLNHQPHESALPAKKTVSRRSRSTASKKR
jgi:acetoin utilization protein AcuB